MDLETSTIIDIAKELKKRKNFNFILACWEELQQPIQGRGAFMYSDTLTPQQVIDTLDTAIEYVCMQNDDFKE